MLELGGDLRLPAEAADGVRVPGELRVEDLDRDVAVQGGLPGAVDRPHAAGADRLLDAELVEEELAEKGVFLALGRQPRAVLLAKGRRCVVADATERTELGRGDHGF